MLASHYKGYRRDTSVIFLLLAHIIHTSNHLTTLIYIFRLHIQNVKIMFAPLPSCWQKIHGNNLAIALCDCATKDNLNEKRITHGYKAHKKSARILAKYIIFYLLQNHTSKTHMFPPPSNPIQLQCFSYLRVKMSSFIEFSILINVYSCRSSQKCRTSLWPIVIGSVVQLILMQ